MNYLKTFDLNFKEKHKAQFLCAMDETARGSMAFDFVAACVIMPDDYYNEKVNDSKQLSENLIIQLSEEIKNHALYYDIVSFSSAEIDNFGIQYVNIKAFEVLKSNALSHFENCVFLVDGNIMADKSGFWSLVKGDSNSFSIACASIIAKEYRDTQIKLIAEKYPQWNLDKNKGYGQDYIDRCKTHGYPDIHRKSYKIKDDKQIKFF